MVTFVNVNAHARGFSWKFGDGNVKTNKIFLD